MTTTAPSLGSIRADTDSCVSPVQEVADDATTAGQLAGIFKALADPTRVRLLEIIAASAGGEACVCDLTEPVDLAQPTVSHHLKVLVAAGLLTREQRGRWAYYSAVPNALGNVAAALQDLENASRVRGAGTAARPTSAAAP